MEKIDKDYKKKKLEKFRLNFLRWAKRDIASLNIRNFNSKPQSRAKATKRLAKDKSNKL